MGVKTIANVRVGSHRYKAIEAIIAGVAANKSHEEICADIFTAVSNNGGAITKATSYGWYRDLHAMIKNADESDICPPPPAKAPRAKAVKADPVETVTAEEPKPVDTQEMLAELHDAVIASVGDTEVVDPALVAKLDEELRASE